MPAIEGRWLFIAREPQWMSDENRERWNHLSSVFAAQGRRYRHFDDLANAMPPGVSRADWVRHLRYLVKHGHLEVTR